MNFDILAFSIIEKAVNDYKLLLELNTAEINFCNEGKISKVEIEDFFKSDLCDSLLQNIDMTGEDILKYLNT